MEDLGQFMTEVVELTKNAQTSYHITTKAMKEAEECFKRIHDDFSVSCDSLSRTMMENIEMMQEVLRQSALQDNPIKAYCLLDSLKACFSKPNQPFMETLVPTKQRQFKETEQVLHDFLAAKRDEMLHIRTILSNYLSAKSPGTPDRSLAAPNDIHKSIPSVTSLDTNRDTDAEEIDRLSKLLHDNAHSFSVPATIVPDDIYVVLNNDRKWFRAIVGLPCGKFQVGDEPIETLYKCYLVDVGHHERITENRIRVLSGYLKELPFLFKEYNHVKSFEWRIPSFKEHTPVDHVMKHSLTPIQHHSAAPLLASLKKFKPKYDRLELQMKPVKASSVIITNATLPTEIYCQIVDDDLPKYQQMQANLQFMFGKVTNQSLTYCASPVIGHPYALRYNRQWYRVLVERLGDAKIVFYVDTGVRQAIHSDMQFHNLPDTFMELPAQAIRCLLDNVFPLISLGKKSNRYIPHDDNVVVKKIRHFMYRYKGVSAVSIFTMWESGQVGQDEGCRRRGPRELTAYAVVYPNDSTDSINVQVGRSHLALLGDDQIEFPEHRKICERLMHQVSPNPENVHHHQLNVVTAPDAPLSGTKPAQIEKFKEAATTDPKFKPKFSLLELKKNPLKHANVFITKAAHPKAIYVQIQDEDMNRYHQMQNDLQEEFRTATIESHSYCPTPIVGHAYAANAGREWRRVLIQRVHGYTQAFEVDTGNYETDLSKIMFHNLPNKYMDLPAQAVRCSLLGVSPPDFDKFPPGRFPRKIYEFMDQFHEKPAVSIFCYWHAGDMHYFDKTTPPELECQIVLYPIGDSDSVNLQVCRTSMAVLTSRLPIQRPWHYGVRQELPDDKEIKGSTRSEWIPEEDASLSSHYFSETIGSVSEVENEVAMVCRSQLIEEELTVTAIFVGCQSPDDIYFRTPELVRKFIRVQDALRTLFDSRKTSSVVATTNLDIGLVCAVHCEGKWFRAEIIDMEKYPGIIVCLRDVGCSRKVNISDIRRLPEELANLPRTVFRCSLHGIYPLTGTTWDGKTTQYVRSRLQGAEKSVIRFRKHPNNFAQELLPVTVNIFEGMVSQLKDPNGRVQLNLNDHLVSIGLASPQRV